MIYGTVCTGNAGTVNIFLNPTLEMERSVQTVTAQPSRLKETRFEAFINNHVQTKTKVNHTGPSCLKVLICAFWPQAEFYSLTCEARFFCSDHACIASLTDLVSLREKDMISKDVGQILVRLLVRLGLKVATSDLRAGPPRRPKREKGLFDAHLLSSTTLFRTTRGADPAS